MAISVHHVLGRTVVAAHSAANHGTRHPARKRNVRAPELAMIWLALTGLGCGSAPLSEARGTPQVGPVKMVVTWRNYEGWPEQDPSEAIIVIDGNDVGKGEMGFLRILDEMREIPKGSYVYFKFTHPRIAITNSGSAYTGRSWPGSATVPFLDDDRLYRMVRLIVSERSLHMEYVAP
jgi:hypothetical protein